MILEGLPDEPHYETVIRKIIRDASDKNVNIREVNLGEEEFRVFQGQYMKDHGALRYAFEIEIEENCVVCRVTA